VIHSKELVTDKDNRMKGTWVAEEVDTYQVLEVGIPCMVMAILMKAQFLYMEKHVEKKDFKGMHLNLQNQFTP
jgi:hypothetical protein